MRRAHLLHTALHGQRAEPRRLADEKIVEASPDSLIRCGGRPLARRCSRQSLLMASVDAASAAAVTTAPEMCSRLCTDRSACGLIIYCDWNCWRCIWHGRLRSTTRGDFIVPRFNRHLSNSSFSVSAPSAWNRLPSHSRTSSTYTLFLTRLRTHLFAESLLWHCDAVVFLLYFWRPRALDVGRHSKFMLIDLLKIWYEKWGSAEKGHYTRMCQCSIWNIGYSEEHLMIHTGSPPLSSLLLPCLPLHDLPLPSLHPSSSLVRRSPVPARGLGSAEIDFGAF